MNRQMIVSPAAEADLREARDWYESQYAGLGDQFLDLVAEVLELVRSNPKLFAIARYDLRIARVRKFPYLVVFREDDDQITIVAVYHGSRDPRGWQTRQ